MNAPDPIHAHVPARRRAGCAVGRGCADGRAADGCQARRPPSRRPHRPPPALDRTQDPAGRQDAGAARARLDEDDAGQRRRAHRLGEARPAAGVVLAEPRWAVGAVRAGRQAGPRQPHGGDDERGHEDARRRGAVERDAAARHDHQRRHRQRVGRRELRLDERASSRRRSTSCADMLVNSTFPADALERLRAQRLVALTQAKAQPAVDRGARLPARALRRRAPVRRDDDRGIAQGDHARRRRRVPEGVLPARARRHRRDGRRERGRGRRRRREGAGGLAGRRREAGVLVPGGAAAAGRRRSTSWTSRAPRSRPSRSATRARRAARPTTTRSR